MEGSLAGDPGEYVEKALEMGTSFHRGPAGEPGRGHIYQGLWERMKEALGMECFSLKRLSVEDL